MTTEHGILLPILAAFLLVVSGVAPARAAEMGDLAVRAATDASGVSALDVLAASGVLPAIETIVLPG